MSELTLENLHLKEDDCPSTDETHESEDDFEKHWRSDEMTKHSAEMSVSEVYLQACRLEGVIPVSHFIRNLGNSSMSLKHCGLNSLGCKAIAIALVDDVHIRTLELADNNIQADGAKYLLQMLRVNCTIEHLDLSWNYLMSDGAEWVAKMMVENISLKCVKVSGSKFIDEDAKPFADAMSINSRLKELDLSYNEFCGKGGEYLGQLLANNEGLEVLNLSWNHLRMKGAVAFCAGLKVNMTLKHLDLSWNGFGNDGALAIGEALKFNSTLLHLNLNNNRLTDEGISLLCRGMEFNETLQTLHLDCNSLTVEGALVLVNLVRTSPRSALEEINLSNVLVNENFVHMLEMTRQENPDFKVHYRGVGGFITKKQPKRSDPMKVVQDYLDKRKLRLWDFFRNIDKDGTMQVPVSDFRRAIQQSGVPLERFQVEELIQRLDRGGTGIVDYRGLADTRKQMMRNHRIQLKKVESRQKKEKQKSDRILKTFQSAVEAVTPHSSMVISPGGAKEEANGLKPFSATPLTSWDHIVMSNSSRYSVTNLSGDPTQRRSPPTLGVGSSRRPTSSPGMLTHSQPNLHSDSPQSMAGKLTSAHEIHSDTEISRSKMSPTGNSLTQSRPALSSQRPEGADKTKKKKKKKTIKPTKKESKKLLKTQK